MKPTGIKQFRATALATLAGFFVVFGAGMVAVAEHAQYVAKVRAQVVSDVSGARAKLESNLADRLVLTDALAALTVANSGEVEEEFESFAESLDRNRGSYEGSATQDQALRSLQLAPGAVVTYVYPIEGNEAAIGHDLLADPQRGAAVQRAIDERRFVLAGPFELLQGGLGLVGRNPIYLDADSGSEFWGFATVVIDFDALALEAGLGSAGEMGIDYALKGRDGTGASGEVFYGQPHIFDHDPVALDVLVPNGTWQLAAHPTEGWPVFPGRPISFLILGAGLALAGVVSVSIWRWMKARQSVERISQDLQRLIDSTTSPIIALDSAGVITEWNDAIAQLTSVSRADAIGMAFVDTWQDVAPSAANDVLFGTIDHVLAGGSGDVATVTLSEGVMLLFTVAPRQLSDGGVGVVCIGQDLTARLEAEEMRAENVALARTARLKDEFLAGMSHELRTPLNAIIGLSQVLNRQTFGTLNDKQETYVGQIERSGQHLLDLINDVLDLAKLDAAAELDLQTVDVRAVVEESIELIAHMAERRGLALHEPEAGSPLEVTVDPLRIRQIVVNLLSNAVKFTERGGEIGAEIHEFEHRIEVVVWDTGIGISPESLPTLFEPFLQVDGSLAREQEGTGLGLAIAAKLARLHGGDISVSSVPSRGSRFAVSLPRRANTSWQADGSESAVPLSGV